MASPNSPVSRYQTKHVIDMYIEPGSKIYSMFFLTLRIAERIGLLKVNTKIQYIENPNWIFILTPLAGSSSIRVLFDDVKVHDVTKQGLPSGFEAGERKICYLLSRTYSSRLRSFYNKKVRNPTSPAKAKLLATCFPLSHTTSPQEFVDWATSMLPLINKDKHLYTDQQIIDGFGFEESMVVKLDIAADATKIEDILGIQIGERVNTTELVSSYAKPLELPPLR